MAYTDEEKALIRRLTLEAGGDDPDFDLYSEFVEDDPTDDRLRREYAEQQAAHAEAVRAPTAAEQAAIDRWAKLAEEIR